MGERRFHFDLSHLGNGTAAPLRFHAGTATFALIGHDDRTRQQAVRDNAAVAAIGAEHHQRITHYADVTEEALPDETITRLRITYDHGDPGYPLPALVHMSLHLPRFYRQHVRARRLAEDGLRVHPLLEEYGVGELGHAEAPHVWEAAEHFIHPKDIARSLIFHHPELASRDGFTATHVMDRHIDAAENRGAVRALYLAISAAGPATPHGGWATIRQTKQPNGTPYTYEHDVFGHKQGEPVFRYALSPQIHDALGMAVHQCLRSARNDAVLQNRKWSVSHGVTSVRRDAAAAQHPLPMNTAVAGEPSKPKFKWTILDPGDQYGMNVHRDTLQFEGGRFSIDVKNDYLRTMSAYVELRDEAGNPIADPKGWDGPGSHYESATKKYVTSVQAVNTIMAHSAPTDSTGLDFVWPEEATSARLLFGSLGHGSWDSVVSPIGTIVTSIFQYGIPMFFLAASVLVESTEWYATFIRQPANVFICVVVGGEVMADLALVFDTKQVLFAFGEAIIGIMSKRLFTSAAKEMTKDLAKGEAEDATPFVGWVFEAMAVVVGLRGVARTTGEVCSSPAVVEYEVRRAFDLHFTLHPDPEHGEPGHPETAIWPAVGHHYLINVQYKGGTNFEDHGRMPLTTSNEPLRHTFALPAGGSIRITAAIYSESGWVCGKWSGDWIEAMPASGTTDLYLEGSITEQLVPLTTDTNYIYKEKIVFDAAAQKHVWQAGDPPVATVTSVHGGDSTLLYCSPLGLTIFEKMYEIGYVWKGARQGLPMCGETAPATEEAFTFQNLSVLAEPDRRLMGPTCTLRAQPHLIYDQYGPMPTAAKPSNHFLVDPRGGDNHLRRVVLDQSTTYDLASPGQSWGRFGADQLDAVVIHPDGYAIGVHGLSHKVLILPIAKTGSSDAQAPVATVASGLGTLEGLVNEPVALTVALDGRVLLVEKSGLRIQAFDTKGSPVASFDGRLLLHAGVSFKDALGRGEFPAALEEEFRQHGVVRRFALDPALTSVFAAGTVTKELRSNLAAHGMRVSTQTTIETVTAGSRWVLHDNLEKRRYLVVADGSGLTASDTMSNVKVTTRTAGQRWIVDDPDTAHTYDLRLAGDTIDVYEFLSYMRLKGVEGSTSVQYIDIATEARGFIYVLLYKDNGANASDYFLDIYEPDGTFLCRTPNPRLGTTQHVAAARLVIDIWRNAYTLNYEALLGAAGRIEPSIGHWMPTPPLFELPLTKGQDFTDANVSAIRASFAEHGHTLSAPTVHTRSQAGYWNVIDGATTYEVIRSGSAIYVYTVVRP